MTQVTAAMQKIIDRFGWAERLPSVAEAAQSLARHVDARLTALEAAKPKDADQQARELIAEIKRLRADNANLEAAKNYWLNGSGTLLWRLDALEAQRNALAAEVDDLRNVNAGLRAALSSPAPCTGTGSGGCDCLPDEED